MNIYTVIKRAWTIFIANIMVPNYMFCSTPDVHNLTLASTLNVLLNHVLIKEPSTRNPFKLVYDVISYAINKCPRRRSAFTFCEDVIPSHIDFGKSNYGGPFSTEQV